MDTKKSGLAGWIPAKPSARAEMPGQTHASLPNPMPTPPTAEPEICVDDLVLVMSYVKMQEWGQVYEGETGLERGTIFPELDLPFLGGECNYE